VGIKAYIEDGKEYFMVQIHVRSKGSRKIRVQKRLIKIATRSEAEDIYLKEYKKACTELAKKESEGLTWKEVIEAWREWYKRYPSDRWDVGTVKDYIAMMYNWTPDWLNKPVSKLSVADGFQLIQEAKDKGASTKRLYQLKTVINVIHRWGIQAGKVVGVAHSPMFGIELKKKDEDSFSEILNRDQVSELLLKAESAEHEWFPVWKVASYTGMRSGELEALRKPDIELVSREEARRLDTISDEKKSYGFIRVQRQWKRKENKYGPTKGRMARTVPISSKLYWFLVDYIETADFGADEFGERVFELFSEHRSGQQARVLKNFCASKGLPEIKFHTFRACFATHLLSAGVEELKVMKIGGWKDRETMMSYIRLAGVDELGATEKLNFEARNHEVVPCANVVSLFGPR